MQDDIAVQVEHVSKTFKLPHEKQTSIKGALIGALRRGNRSFERQQVLDDVTFDVKKGEFFGIVGRNGSGKSTLLKILSGIYQPTTGSVQVSGKLIPFIELGVGFNYELTGRENVYLNGALLGFNRTEMQAMYDEIVDFAEIERFMDQKLKNYSSGMQVRLAFSIAIRARSDILILDEVLAVGDESFQQKCIDVFEQYKAQKKTVILVTHDMASVNRFCSRALLIDNSKVVEVGKPAKIADMYTKLNQQQIDKQTESRNELAEAGSFQAKITDTSGRPVTSFRTDDNLNISFAWTDKLKLQNIGAAIMKETGEMLYGVNTLELDSMKDVVATGRRSFDLSIKLNLGPGRYYVMYGAFGADRHQSLEFHDKGPSFIVKKDSTMDWEGIVNLEADWHGSDK